MYNCLKSHDAVLTDDYQANECLGLPIDDKAPSPVVLESTITNDNFVCKDRPTLYTFSCTVYGSDLIWHFNRERISVDFKASMELALYSASLIHRQHLVQCIMLQQCSRWFQIELSADIMCHFVSPFWQYNRSMKVRPMHQSYPLMCPVRPSVKTKIVLKYAEWRAIKLQVHHYTNNSDNASMTNLEC